MYLEQKDIKSANNYLIESIKQNPNNLKAIKLQNYVKNQNVVKVLNEAYDYYEKEDYKKALEVANRASVTYPNNAQVFYYRAVILEAMKMYPEAIKDYETCIKINRNFTIGYYSLAVAYEKYNRGRDALDYYERYLSLYPKEEELIKQAEQKVIELGNKYY